MSQWWVTEPGKQPVGPFDEGVVVRKLSSGEIPSGALVCVVGGDRWEPVREVPAFAAALQGGGLHRFEEAGEDKTIVDDMPLALQDEPEEETAVDRRPAAKPRA